MNFDAKTWNVVDYDNDYGNRYDVIDVTVDDIVDNDVADDFNFPVWLTPKNVGIALLILIELFVLGSLLYFGFENFVG